MKKKLAITLLLLLITSATAFAKETFSQPTYTVAKGDCLWQIGEKLGIEWEKIARDNNISKPYTIYPNQKLSVTKNDLVVKGEVESLLNRFYRNPKEVFSQLKGQKEILSYSHPGGDKWRGNLNLALELLAYPQEVAEALKVKVNNNEYELRTEDSLKNGDIFLMTYGKDKVKLSIGDWSGIIKENENLAAKKYTVVVNGNTWVLLQVLICKNWVRPPEEKRKSIKIITAPAKKKSVVILNAEEGVRSFKGWCYEDEHEPIIGAGRWRNRLARGRFAYAEYMYWLKSCESEYSFGLGIYGMIEDGESKQSDYEWDGRLIGPQVGVKRTWIYLDKEGNSRFQQWQIKFRLVKERTDGKNPSSGYRITQYDLKAGLYSEYVREFNDKWIGIFIAEGWYGFDKTRRSTWSGDKPSSRNLFSLGIYAQYKFTDNVQVRFGGGPFYQRWDRMTGINLRAELRLWETVMIGPYFNFFPFRLSKEYTEGGYHKTDLNTWGLFIRVEFGGIFRKVDQKRRMDRIRKIDMQELGIEGF